MMSKGNRTSGTAGDIRITDPSNKNSSDHKKPSPGPLSSIKAAIKRSKPSSQSDQRKGNCRRRPEITVVSAEPLDCSSSSPGSPLVSSALHTPSLQVPTQVPTQRTQEAHIKPVAPPRHLNGTATTATTTTPKSTGLKPPKPPRPSAPKNKKTSTVTDDHTNGILTLEPSHIIQDFDSNSTNCTQSVTVHWNDLKTSSAPHTTFNTASNCLQCPVPLPRIKSKRLLIPQEESQTLVQLSGDSDPSDPVLNSATPNKYLQELLEVFHSEKSYIINQLSAETEDVDKMSATNNLRARIQAFESQAEEASEPGRPQPQARKTRPAVATKPSAVATKPSVVAKPQFISDDLYDNVSSSPPSPAPKPARKPLGKTNSVKDELNAILSQHRSKPPKLSRDVSVHDEGFAKEPPTPMVKPVQEPLKPNLNINNHNNYSTQPVYEDAEDAADDTEDPTYSEYEYVERPSEGFGNAHEFPALDEDNTSQGPDTTESQYEYVEYQTDKAPEKVPPKTYEEKPSNILPVKPKSTMNNYVSRQSLNRRPTTIIVPSKSASFSDGSQDNPPALPVHKPVGARKAPPVNRHSIASFPTQVSHSPTPEPSLPPRRLTTSKTLPPRPPLVKSGPGRPPAPRMEAAGRSNTVPWDSPPQPQATQNRDPVLPPRPNPGHKLYNKYTLQVPHAVAANDFNGSNSSELSFQKNEVLVLLNTIDPNTYECQVGDRRGRVHRSSLKVITPLTTASDDSATQGDKRTTLSKGLTVKALHDFNPENPGELGLKAGDIVTMVEQVDSEWYRGTCQGSSGFFPINYVKVQANSPRPPDKPAKKPAATVSGPRCVARFDFEGEHSDELSFSEGDTIQLKAFVGQDWARGKLGSVTGIFPLNFVEIIEDLPPGPSQQPTKPIKPTKSTKSTKIALPGMSKSSHTPETSQAQSGSEWSVALYDFSGNSEGDLSFEKGDRILVTKHIDEEWSSGTLNGQEGIFPRAFVSNNKAGKTCSHQNGSAGGVSAKALYDYASDCDEELSLKVGDIVANIEIVDDEWFLGDLKGKRALVPKNYVEVL